MLARGPTEDFEFSDDAPCRRFLAKIGMKGSSCARAALNIGNGAGFVLAQDKAYTGPLWLSEFGVPMTLKSGDSDYQYLQCLRQYLESNDADWAYWALQGDYYVRDRTVNLSESFGLLNDDWSSARNPSFIGYLGKMMNITQGP